MKNKIILTLFVLLIIGLLNGKSQVPVKTNILAGKWGFIRFDWPNFVPDTASVRSKFQREFKGTTYLFTKDKRLIINQPNVATMHNVQLVWALKGEKLYISPTQMTKNKQIADIDFLDENYLKLYVEGYDPVGVFQRIK